MAHRVPRAIRKAVSIEDLRQLARRRLPRILFDYIDGGAGDDGGVRHNRRVFDRYRLKPRYLIDVTGRTLAARLWDRTFAAPFGIAPVGLVGLFRARGEQLLAEAARDAGIPYVLSGASIATIEDVAAIAPAQTWYQLYPARDPAVSLDLVRRAAAAGLGVLVLTVDLPVPARRARDLRNGFDFDVRLTPSLLLDGLRHPGWSLEYLWRGGLPSFGSWARYAPGGPSPRAVGEYVNAQAYATQTWRNVDEYRRAWPGRFVLKGIQHEEDARRAVDAGVDGLIVSNHGGRQLDCLPAACEVLPGIRAAVGRELVLMVDGGIRSGSDLAIALSLGADFAFIGRAPIYGVVAGGRAGADRVLHILREELDLAMGQIGALRVTDLSPDRLLVTNPGGT